MRCVQQMREVEQMFCAADVEISAACWPQCVLTFQLMLCLAYTRFEPLLCGQHTLKAAYLEEGIGCVVSLCRGKHMLM